jgi:hypothetical protein
MMSKKKRPFLPIISLVLTLMMIVQFISSASPLNVPPTFALSFRIRDRTQNNRIDFDGVMNVKNNFEETEVMIHHSNLDEKKNYTAYYYNGQVVQEHLDENEQEQSVCFRDKYAPQLSSLYDAVLNSRVISVMDNNTTQIFDREVMICVKQQWMMYEVTFMSEVYVVCISEQMKPVRIIARDMLIDIVTFSPLRTIQWLSDKVQPKVQSCKKSVSSTDEEPQQLPKVKLQPWYSSYKDSCRYRWVRDPVNCQLFEDAPRSRSLVDSVIATKTCIFLHGVGNTQEEAGPPVHEYPDYWGQVHEFTPQCKERWFIREETKSRGWDNLELQQAFCNMALINQTAGDTIVRDKILFVHSMGNLILAGAIKNKLCDIDRNNTSWYEIQGPLGGSKAAYELELICLYIHNGEWVRHLTPRFVKWVATTGGYCVPGTNQSYAAYDTLAPTYNGIKDLYAIAKPRIKGAMCGDSPYGLNSLYSAALYSLSFYVGYGDINDGMVPFASCRTISVLDFSLSYQDQYYLATINHADGTCRDGNGYWGITRQPCSWYTDKV